MQIVCISDTHGQHHALKLPPGDMLIHAGDLSTRGKSDELRDFLHWFASQPYQHKIFIGGNHDFLLERESKFFRTMVPRGCTYLNDEPVEIKGIRIWGSPITPFFHDWAFNRRRGDKIRRHWALIPDHVDLLVTHGPPLGILDQTTYGDHVGCADLLERLAAVRPKVHLFGHIHEGYGKTEQDGTVFINASCVDTGYRLVNAPVVMEM